MMNYEVLIDPTNFGTVVRHLQHAQSPIEFLLHVKNESMLAELAQRVATAGRPGGRPVTEVTAHLDRLLEERSLRVSSRHPMQARDPRYVIDAATIPNSAGCSVIYLPPYYLVHTPGLFEGTLKRNAVAKSHGLAPRRAPGFRMKP